MKTVISLVVIIGVLSGALWYMQAGRGPQAQERQFGPTDRLTPEAAWRNADEDMIVVDLLTADRVVSNPFTVSGKARGNWYFEASFPIQVVDQTGAVLVTMPVQAQGEWMTSEFVPFSAEVKLPDDFHGPATLVLHNDNASGLPEHDRSVSIPIFVE